MHHATKGGIPSSLLEISRDSGKQKASRLRYPTFIRDIASFPLLEFLGSRVGESITKALRQIQRSMRVLLSFTISRETGGPAPKMLGYIAPDDVQVANVPRAAVRLSGQKA